VLVGLIILCILKLISLELGDILVVSTKIVFPIGLQE
jgi:hypothetical protein